MSKPTFKQRIKAPRRPQRALKIFWGIVIAPFAIVLLMILLAIFGVFGPMPSFQELENPRSSIATEIISSDGGSLGGYFIENRSYASYDELSPSLVAALVATEDKRFYSHSGIDFVGLSRVAFKSLLLNSDQGGGSTVSQQLAKNLYPRDTASRSTMGRKLRLVTSKFKEWVTAVKLEYNYTKEEIIAMYLTTVQYGSNAFGIKSAARTFFNKTPSELTVPEAALLVGVVNAPSRYSPVSKPENALKRRNTVIERMESAGFITNQQAKEYVATPIQLDYHPVSNNEGRATYFREMMRLYMSASQPERDRFANDWDFQADLERWKTDPLYGWCSKNKKADGTSYDLYRDGLKIYTTINSKMQQYAEEALIEQMGAEKVGIQAIFDRQRKNYGTIFYNITKDQKESIMNSAMLNSERGRTMKKEGASREQILAAFKKPERMRVFTYRGDRDTTLTPYDSIIHSKAVLRSSLMALEPTTGYVRAYVGGTSFRNFKYDMVRQGRRQIGSTVKPFVYTFAFDYLGYNPCTMVPNLPVSIENGAGGDAFSPKEASRVEYDGVMHPLRWGLANSRNNYSAWIIKQASPSAVADLIHKMGISTYIDPVYSIATGSPEASLYEMVGAFATYANRGVHTEPLFVTRIEDRQGNVLSSFSPHTSDAISEKTAYTMLSMLQSNISAGTGGKIRYMFNILGEYGGKTGTTNNNADAWFIGVAPRLVAGAWVGGEERSTHLVSGGEGSVAALPIVGRFMNKVYRDKSLGITQDDKFMIPIGGAVIDCDPGVNGQQGVISEDGTGVVNNQKDEFFD